MLFLSGVVKIKYQDIKRWGFVIHPNPILTPCKKPISPGLRFSQNLDLGGDLGLAVDDLDAELLGAGDDVDSLAG